MESVTQTKMLHVPFQQTPDVYQAVATNEVNWAPGTAGSAGPLQRAGKASPRQDITRAIQADHKRFGETVKVAKIIPE